MKNLFRRFQQNEKEHSLLRLLQYIVFGSFILYFGRNLLIPFSYALFISFILYPICNWLERKRVSRALAILLSLTLLFILLVAVVGLLINQLTLFSKEWPLIRIKLHDLMADISRFFIDSYAISKEQQQQWMNETASGSLSYVMTLIRSALSASVYSGVLFVLVPVYAALILYYRSLLLQVVAYLFPGERKEDTKRLLSLAIQAYYNFIKGMIIVYLIVGTLNSIGLLIIGVPHAFFFGFTTSVLTFIPYIGIILGALLPIGMAWITFGSMWYPVAVVLVFVFVQYLEANVIFPLAVSNRLSINPLATLLVITLGGLFWGVSGMILFVPFLAILKLVADRQPSMKIISLMTGLNTR